MGASGRDRIRTLFVCRYNQRRSATAERVFAKDPSLDVRSAGTSDEALVPVNERMLEWADIIFVMEKTHRNKLQQRFRRQLKARVICLDIPDEFEFMDPMLVRLLETRVSRYLR